MLEYEALRPLFQFLQMPKNNKKHWSDNFSWTMVKFMHQDVLRETKAIVGATCYVALMMFL
jgi:hypothetical protein